MTRLRFYRKATGQKLREVGSKVGVTPQTVHDTEVRGIQTPRLAVKYGVAFPGVPWHELIEPPNSGEAAD